MPKHQWGPMGFIIATTEHLTPMRPSTPGMDNFALHLASLSSSIQDYVYENGRRYHSLNAGRYVIPNDENEQQRLNMYHHARSLLLGGALHVVEPPTKLKRILDLGTGTGIWAIDMADAHPEAHVIGVDLSPIQPNWVPPNCSFEVDDIEQPWLWKEPFDFIHSSNLALGLHDWPTYTKRMYENLVPGGVVQLLECRLWFHSDDDTTPKGGHIERYIDNLNRAAQRAGLRDVCEELEEYLVNAGFVDVRATVKKLPIGPWPKDPAKKELGQWGLAVVDEGLRTYGLQLFTKFFGYSYEEATQLCDDARTEFRRRDVHTYNSQWFVEGRKPEA